MRKRFIVFGHKRHGKDTVGEYLREHYGIHFDSSSMFICKKFLFEKMRHSHGYQTIEECFEDRVNHRPYWFDEIRAYTLAEPTRLGREIFQENEMYCGIRSEIEYHALRNAGVFDLGIFVDASERLPKEDYESMKLGANDADIVIPNNGTLEELYFRVDRLMQAMGYNRITKKEAA